MAPMHNPQEDLTGQRFGEWVVVGRHESGGKKGRRWLCKCSCPRGTLSIKTTSNVREGGGCVHCRSTRVRTKLRCSTNGCGAEIELPLSVAKSHEARAGVRCRECHRLAADWASRVGPMEVKGRVCYWCLRKDADTSFHNNVECEACARRASRTGRCSDCLAPLTNTFVHVCGVPTPVLPARLPRRAAGVRAPGKQNGGIDLSARGRGRCPVCDSVIPTSRAVCSTACRVTASRAGVSAADVWQALAQEAPAPQRSAARVSSALKRLSYRQREVLNLRLGLRDGYEYTRKEVAEIFGQPVAVIARVEATALVGLGRHLGIPMELQRIQPKQPPPAEAG